MLIQYRLNMVLNPPPGGGAVRRCDRPEQGACDGPRPCAGVNSDKCCLAWFYGADACKQAEDYLAKINPGGAMASGAGRKQAAAGVAAIHERLEAEAKEEAEKQKKR